MSLDLADKIYLVIGTVGIGGTFVCLGVTLHMAYKQTDLLLSYFKNSPAVISLGQLRHGGPWGKLLMIGGICNYVSFSSYSIKRGSICVRDFISLPATIKLKLILLQRCNIACLIIIIGMWAAVQVGVV